MTAAETIDVLWVWSPFLAEGFGWNIIVSLVAMAIGTVVGMVLALLRGGSNWGARHGGSGLTTLARNAPTFVMLFYLAYIIPTEFTLFGASATFPAWIKASLALGIAVAGYVSDNALAAIRHLRRTKWRKRCSSCGLDELFPHHRHGVQHRLGDRRAGSSCGGRIRLSVRRRDRARALGLPLAMIWFLGFSILLSLGMNRLSSHIRRRVHRAAGGDHRTHRGPAAVTAPRARYPIRAFSIAGRSR